MPIIVCGISHKTAPVALREQVIFAEEKIPLYLNDLIANEKVREAVLLSTCNRSELYCEADEVEHVVDWFCRQHVLSRKELESVLYIYRDGLAVQHMMNVACGLDSMVLGEPQILGQMKEAFSESCAAGSVGTLFNRLFQQIFAVAKEVRTHTAIGACPVSISSSAVNLIKHHFQDSLTQASILLLGAGDTIQIALKYLKPLGLKKIILINRNIDNARKLTADYSVDIASMNELPSLLSEADILLSATGSMQAIVTFKMLEKRKAPIFILDIAVPRDVEESVSVLPCVTLFSIDDLKSMVQHNRHGREHAAEKAYEMIKIKSEVFMHWLHSLDEVAITIRAYRQQIEELCHAELIKFQRLLQRGEDPSDVLTGFAHSLTNKLLHHPSVQLRQAGFEGRFDLLDLAKQLFAVPKTELI